MTMQEATEITERVQYMPFGVSELDGNHLGIPTGSAVLLAGAQDAGTAAFTYTSLARLMQARHRPSSVPDRLAERREPIPDHVTYLSVTKDREHIYTELEAVLSDVQFETLTENLTVVDFSQRFLELLPVPPTLFDERRPAEEGISDHTAAEGDDTVMAPEEDGDDAVDDPIEDESFGELLDDIGARLAEARGDLLVVDSLSDLRRATNFGLGAGRDIAFLAGLREAVVNWESVAYVKYDRRAGEARSDPSVQGLLHGALYFYSNDQGVETYRTMRVGSFGGALDTDRQMVFESVVGDSGFRAKATKKIGRLQF